MENLLIILMLLLIEIYKKKVLFFILIMEVIKLLKNIYYKDGKVLINECLNVKRHENEGTLILFKFILRF